MILCIGYGPNPEGRVYNRFGPINQEGGQRRLNVAITRAKLRLTVVRSLKPSDITPNSQGARMLRRFLEFVDYPDTAFRNEAVIDAGAESESPFEDAVASALIERGFRIERQIGAAGYRVDLAVLSEDGSGIDLGIECDGATYHRAPAARDRDWLRQQVLERLGWRIHRVWSTSWIRDRESELESIAKAVEKARAIPPLPFTSPDSSLIIDEESRGYEFQGSADASNVNDDSTQNTKGFEDYVEASLERADGNSYNRTARGIAEIASVEGPVHVDVISKRLRDQPLFSGLSSSVHRQQILRQIDFAQRRGAVKERDGFVWTSDEQLSQAPRRPSPGARSRSIEHISLAELKMAVLLTVQEIFGGTQKELTVQTARNLGYQRTGRLISERLGTVISTMLKGGELEHRFDSIVASTRDPAA